MIAFNVAWIDLQSALRSLAGARMRPDLIALSAEQGRVTLCHSNPSGVASLSVPADVAVEGQTVVEFRHLEGGVRAFAVGRASPQRRTLHLSVRTSTPEGGAGVLALSGEGLELTLPLQRLTAFPASKEPGALLGIFDRGDFLALCARSEAMTWRKPRTSSRAASSIPLGAVHTSFDGQRMTMIATDRHRVNRDSIPGTRVTAMDEPLLIPSSLLKRARSVLRRGDALRVHHRDGLLRLSADHAFVEAALDHGNYPPMEEVLDSTAEVAVEVLVDHADLTQAILRVQAVERGLHGKVGMNPTLLRVASGDRPASICSTAISSGGPAITVPLPVKVERRGVGGPEVLGVGFNSKYLLAALADFAGERVTLRLHGSQRAIFLLDEARPSYTHALMPMWDESVGRWSLD